MKGGHAMNGRRSCGLRAGMRAASGNEPDRGAGVAGEGTRFGRLLAAGLMIWACMGSIVPAARAATIYVATTGSGANNGQSWAMAKRTVAGGLTAAVPGDQVWVAAGIYVERITLKNGVALYGGFAGTETELAQRNWVANKSILDGNKAGCVVTSPSGATASTRIDGFTIRNGAGDNGGGILCSASSPTIANNIIKSSRAWLSGGCVYCDQSSAVIVNNTITGGSAQAGGGILCSGTEKIVNNLVLENGADRGGGIFCSSASTTLITNNTIAGNCGSQGAGIFFFSTAAPKVYNNIIAFNASGIYKESPANPTLRSNCVYNPGAVDYTGLSAGPGDISVDPQFLDLKYGDAHLKARSPCIDQGDSTLVGPGVPDLDGQTRVQGPAVDMGADEFDGTTPNPPTPKIVRVSTSGNNANDGSTWVLAKKTVQAGIDACANLGGGEVWVAKGVYMERINLQVRVFVYGGFAGTEADRSERNFVTQVTVLDGNKAGNVVVAPVGATLSTCVDGFTIRNGVPSSTDVTGGAGVLCFNSSPIIANNVITGNEAYSGKGCGILCRGSQAMIVNNKILNNSASILGGRGGGIDCGGGPVRIVNNVIAGNASYSSGGAISCDGGAAVIASNTIVANASDGGCVYCTSTTATISNNIIAYNFIGVQVSNAASVMRNNCVYGSAWADYYSPGTGTGDISADPRLSMMDFGDVHLLPGSPCIDAGLHSAVIAGVPDMDGQPRIQGAHLDIGADEFNGTTPSFVPQVVWVSKTGDDSRDGSDWASAKKTVQAGIDACYNLGGGEVWVAAGTYNERITMKAWVHLRGGFTGGESSREQRDWVNNPTILDGGAGGSVVSALGGSAVSAVDGFTIRNGTGTQDGEQRYGGGVYCYNSALKLLNDIFTGNNAYRGGGLYCGGASFPQITGCAFIANRATIGGGLASGTVTVLNSKFVDNAASSGGGAVSNENKCKLANCTFMNNTAPGGPAISNSTNANYSSSLANSIIWGHVGAAISDNSSTLDVTYSDIQGGYYGTGNINADPLFVAPYSGDHHLTGPSPCIDAGDPASDFSLEPEPDGGRINMGIYGDTGEAESKFWMYLTGYNLVSSTRIGRTLFEYQFTASLRNVGSAAIGNAALRLLSVPANVQIVEPKVTIGTVPAGATVTTTDTFTIRVDRTSPVAAVAISWRLTGGGAAPMVVTGVIGLPGTSAGDLDLDGDTDGDDLAAFVACMSGPAVGYDIDRPPEGCTVGVSDGLLRADFDRDGDVDQDDFAVFQRCYSGTNKPVDPNCTN